MPCPGSIQLRRAALEHAPNGGHFRRGHAPSARLIRGPMRRGLTSRTSSTRPSSL